MNTIEITAAIARALGHGCSLSVEETQEAVSLRHLGAMMRVKGIRYNDSRDPKYTILACLEGWHEDYVTSRADMPEYKKFVGLSHDTASGRLSVIATERCVSLIFAAGPAVDDDGAVTREAQEIAQLNLFPSVDGLDVVVMEHVFSRDLIVEKPGRLGLLLDIDRREFEGAIMQALSDNKYSQVAQFVYGELYAIEAAEKE